MRLHRVVTLAAIAAAACSSSSKKPCDPADANACGGGAVCEVVTGGDPACFAPVIVKGQVTDLATGSAVAGARVVALDANRAPASAVATTDASGRYSLTVPSARQPSGTPASSVTLRTDAQGYQSFPGGIRAALPIDLSAATVSSDGHAWVAETALTTVGLIALPDDPTTLLSISGKVAKPPSRVGVLVVAEPQSADPVRTAIADVDGTYTVFNVRAAPAPGVAYAVSAYAMGVNYVPNAATVTAGVLAPTGVDLAVKDTATATISSGLIFNSGAATPTSVALVVASTYDTALDRGESPPALVANVPSGNTYSIAGVPDGDYIALAAFGIDGDVRDLSGTGNTAPVEVIVQNGALVGTLGQFKLVGAVDLRSIDGVTVTNDGVPVAIASATPVFTWAKASSYSAAATFFVEVLDAFGVAQWQQTIVPTGGNTYTATYAGAPLTKGMYYQLRIQAIDGAGYTLSQTEDLKGVFFVP